MFMLACGVLLQNEMTWIDFKPTNGREVADIASNLADKIGK